MASVLENAQLAQSLLKTIEGLPFFTNKSKLERLVKAEQAFLERADNAADKITSNLPYLESVVRMCETVNACPEQKIWAVLKRFTGEKTEPTTMEVIATFPSGCQTWIKCLGHNCSSSRVPSLAEASVALAAQNLESSHLRPQICFRFFDGAGHGDALSPELQTAL